MAKFLNTSGTTYHLEELIKNASDRLIIISPYLKLNERIKELLEDRNRFKIDIRIVYGKNDLQPAEINWLKNLEFVRTSFCKNLHAKCYLNESQCIITSLNLYEFSQVNNNEMGVLIFKEEDTQLYTDTYEEAQRIIRISEEVRLSIETVDSKSISSAKTGQNIATKTNHNKANTASDINKEDVKPESSKAPEPIYEKLTTAKLAKKLGLKTTDLNNKFIDLGYLESKDDELTLTEAGKNAGGESKQGRYGEFCLWQADMIVA